MKTIHRSLLFVALSVACLGSAQAQTGTPQNPTVITTAPYTITSSGYYRLGNNINYSSTSGTIIQISASNVTLDFNGFYIAGPVGNTTQTVTGVAANEQSNLTITNGTIAYCYRGTAIIGNNSATTNNVGHRVEKMRVTYCYFEGIYLAKCLGSTVANNQLSQIGGYTGSTNFDANGIDIDGGSVVVDSNVISKVTARGTGTARGIFSNSGVVATRNYISNAAVGIDFGKCYNNLTFFCTTPFRNYIDAGANNGSDS